MNFTLVAVIILTISVSTIFVIKRVRSSQSVVREAVRSGDNDDSVQMIEEEDDSTKNDDSLDMEEFIDFSLAAACQVDSSLPGTTRQN